VEGQITAPSVIEDICINLLLACISSPLPYPLLYLILDSGMIHVEMDNSIYFTLAFDLTMLDITVTEADCVSRCAEILLEISALNTAKELRSSKLLRKKIQHRAYTQFSEVYHDFRITLLPKRNRFNLPRILAFFVEHKDRLFRVLLVLSILCVVIALAMLISYVIFGDFSLFKLFGHSIKTIGTERLNT
jgi:hypothetical protein